MCDLQYTTRCVCLWMLLLVVLSEQQHSAEEAIYMNEFAVKVLGGQQIADRIAASHGFRNVGPIGSLEDYYLFHHKGVSKRSTDASIHHHTLLEGEPEVEWVQQQVELRRRKRDILNEFRSFPLMSSSSFLRNPFASQSFGNGFPDPLYGEQWYLKGGAIGGYDMNVRGAWKKGVTGKGVVVTILDDGIQTDHPDLIQNYDPLASTDINDNDNDPMPQDNGDNKHGTRCAGEVAATAYNGICGVGIAYNASIGGVRMLDGTVNDVVEARALSHNPNHIDIYSASWGPEDDGKTVDGPGPLARKAFLDGVTKGRRGRGSIFIWASGNGGRHDDNCNCDGYTNSIYTLSISSATQHGLKPWYLEECSSTLATTYSSGTPGHDRSIVTVDMDTSYNLQYMCTKEHTGTSASAPIAAAICALALEANSQLTWRDMQYLVMLTSNPVPLEKEAGWIVNGVHRKVSHQFGYGLMDADAMVSLAERWRTVPAQHICEMPPDATERVIPNQFGGSVEFYLDTDGCYGTRRVVNYLEHVQAKISLNFSPRGNLRIVLQSPFGTSSTLLFPRPRDMFKATFDDWPFLSVHFWGERPAGRWRLTIINGGTKPVMQPGVLKKWSLIFYGTEVNPYQASVQPAMSFGGGGLDFVPFGAASSVSLSTVLPGDVTANATGNVMVFNDELATKMLFVVRNCHRECYSRNCASGQARDECSLCANVAIEDNISFSECSDDDTTTTSSSCVNCQQDLVLFNRTYLRFCPHNFTSNLSTTNCYLRSNPQSKDCNSSICYLSWLRFSVDCFGSCIYLPKSHCWTDLCVTTSRNYKRRTKEQLEAAVGNTRRDSPWDSSGPRSTNLMMPYAVVAAVVVVLVSVLALSVFAVSQVRSRFARQASPKYTRLENVEQDPEDEEEEVVGIAFDAVKCQVSSVA